MSFNQGVLPQISLMDIDLRGGGGSLVSVVLVTVSSLVSSLKLSVVEEDVVGGVDAVDAGDGEAVVAGAAGDSGSGMEAGGLACPPVLHN